MIIVTSKKGMFNCGSADPEEQEHWFKIYKEIKCMNRQQENNCYKGIAPTMIKDGLIKKLVYQIDHLPYQKDMRLRLIFHGIQLTYCTTCQYSTIQLSNYL